MEWLNLQQLPVNIYLLIIFPCTYLFTRFRWMVSNKDFIKPIVNLGMKHKILSWMIIVAFYGVFLLCLKFLSKKIQNNTILMTFLSGSLIGLMVASLSDSDAMIGAGILTSTISSLMGCLTLAYMISQDEKNNIYYRVIFGLFFSLITRDLIKISSF